MHQWILIASFALGGISAQDLPPAFEVASVKPSTAKSIRNFEGGPGTRDPGMISYSRATLNDLLYQAYGLQDTEQISGAGWLATEPYDIAARVPAGTTKEQFRMMLQRLLADRFKLTLHHDTKLFPVYELVVGRNGPKLKEPNKDDRPGIMINYSGMHALLTAHQGSLAQLAGILRVSAGRLIFDKTGLSGRYDFTLEFNLRDAAEDPTPTLFDALQQQLGLRLEDRKAPLDVLVIDHAERVPIEN